MDIPGLSTIISKLSTECGILTAVEAVFIIYFAWQLARANTAFEAYRKQVTELRENDKAVMIKLLEADKTSDEKVAIGLATIQTMLLSIQAFRDKG